MAKLLDHIFCDGPRENRSACVEFSGRAVTTTGGTLGTGAANVDTPMFTLTKVGAKAGRYRVQLLDSTGTACVAFKLTDWNFGLIGPSDAAYTTALGVSKNMIRNDLINSAGTFEIQYQKNTDNSDAEVMDGSTIMLTFQIKKGSATP